MPRKRTKPIKPPRLHWLRRSSLYQNTTVCGKLTAHVAMTDDPDKITCKQCARLISFAPELLTVRPGELPSSFTKRKKSEAVDALISATFKAGELRVRELVATARELVADWKNAREHTDPADFVRINKATGDAMSDTLQSFLTLFGDDDNGKAKDR